MGYDTKCNQKDIKTAPGPTDYEVTNINSSFAKPTSNYYFAKGGLKKPDTVTPKEELVIKYFGGKIPRKSVSKARSQFNNQY